MKLAFTIVLSLFITIGSFAQTYLTQARPADNKEWGYMNEKGEWVIEPKYRKCYKFSDGYAPIYEDKTFFFINAKGETLKTEVDDFELFNVFGIGMQGFSDGMAPIMVKKEWGYLNTDGKLAVGLKYDKAWEFDNGFAVVRKKEDFFVINKTGDEFPVNGAIDVKHFSEGLAHYRATDKLFGFIGTDGKVIVKAQFASVGYFSGGLAWAKTKDKKVGFINKEGEWVIKPTYLAAKNFDPISGVAMVKDEVKWNYTDKTGTIIKIASDHKKKFENGLAKGEKGEKWGFYNKAGEWVVQAKYDGVRAFNNGYAAAKKEDKWGFINEKGEWVIEPTLGNVKDMELIK